MDLKKKSVGSGIFKFSKLINAKLKGNIQI